MMVFSCNQENPYQKIKNTKARKLIKASIESYNGLDIWLSKWSLSYKKNLELYNEKGIVEKSIRQRHIYNGKDIGIFSTENDSIHVQISFDQGEYLKVVNGKRVTTGEKHIAKLINSSLFVINTPYNLTDPGADISYLGDTIINGIPLKGIEVRYDANLNKNHSSSETWKYFFDVHNHRIIYTYMISSDHNNMIVNDDFAFVNGILFNTKRRSYRTDHDGNILYLRAVYTYSDFRLSGNSLLNRIEDSISK